MNAAPTLKLKPLVYFVDDEADMLDIFETAFSRKYSVQTFASGYELVDKIASGAIPAPQLIVTDFRMAQMDGVKMLATLHALGHEIPSILLSGNLDKTAAVDALNHGFLRVLEKPFQTNALEAYINELLMEVKIHVVRAEVRKHVKDLTEIHQSMRHVLTDKVVGLSDILDQAVKEVGGGPSHFDEIVGRLENRLTELLKVEEATDALRKGRF